jgi:hypothetical protein
MRESNTWGLHVLMTALAVAFLVELCMFSTYLYGVIFR